MISTLNRRLSSTKFSEYFISINICTGYHYFYLNWIRTEMIYLTCQFEVLPELHTYWRLLFSFIIVILLQTLMLTLKPHRIISLQSSGSSLWLIMAWIQTKQFLTPFTSLSIRGKALYFKYNTICLIFKDNPGSVHLLLMTDRVFCKPTLVKKCYTIHSASVLFLLWEKSSSIFVYV